MKFANEQDKARFESAVAANLSTIVEAGAKEKYDHYGVYCIKVYGVIVYVGKSRNMLKRVAQHMAEIEMNHDKNMYNVLRKLKENGASISFDVLRVIGERGINEELWDDEMGKSEAVLISSYRPCLNIQYPHLDDYHKYDYEPKAKTITAEEVEKIVVNYYTSRGLV